MRGCERLHMGIFKSGILRVTNDSYHIYYLPSESHNIINATTVRKVHW